MQVVTIEHEYGYGASTYTEEEVDLLHFDFSRYSDEVPSLSDLQEIRTQIDKVIIPAARTELERWYKENKEWADDIEAHNDLEDLRQQEIEKAKNLLQEYGYAVKKQL